MSGFTKEIIAKTFTELLDEKPMSKITVKDIVEHQVCEEYFLNIRGNV